MRSIRGLLFPQEGRFFELLEEESKLVLKGAKLLRELLSDYNNSLEKKRKELKKIERQGDDVVHEIYHDLNRAFIAPIDHEDISSLATAYDDVLDYTYSVANRLHVYKVKNSTDTMKEFSKIVYKSVEEIDKALSSMRRLNQKEMDEKFLKIHKLENDADELLDEATGELFKRKDLMEVLKLKEIYEILEATTDRCEDVSDILRNVVIKHT